MPSQSKSPDPGGNAGKPQPDKKKKKKHPGGRPTKYKGEATIKKAREYIKNCVDEMEEIVISRNNKTGKTAFERRLKVKLPKGEGLALHLDITRETMYQWAKEYPQFSDILDQINKIQADRVINEALAGNYNATIAKLLLGKHGYKDESDITTGGQPIKVSFDSAFEKK